MAPTVANRKTMFQKEEPPVRASFLDRVLERAAQVAPGPVAAVIDLLRPGLANGFGGPFNGQQRRIEAIRDMFAEVRFRSVVETGTYRGTTTLYLRGLANVPILTVEASSRYFHYAQRRLRGVSGVTLIRGDSAEVLRSLAGGSSPGLGPAFFYLDAHWQSALPLQSELEAIVAGWPDFAALIDDFKVPGDPGYAYDDYGPGKSLELSILASISDRPIVIYWPAVPSSAETGARRGSVVVASAGLVDDSLRSVQTLRRSGPAATVMSAPTDGQAGTT